MHSLIPLILNLFAAYVYYRKKSPFFSFYVALIPIFSLAHVYYTFSDNIPYQDSVLVYASIQATVFFFASLVTFFLLETAFWNKARTMPDPLVTSEAVALKSFRIAIALNVVALLLIMADYDFSLAKLVLSSWSDARSESSLIKLIASFFIYSGAAFLLLSIKRKSVFGILLFAIMAAVVVFGLKSRSYLVALVAPVLIYEVVHVKIDIRRACYILVVFTLMVAAYSAARSIRQVGTVLDVSSSSGLEVDIGEMELIKSYYFLLDQGEARAYPEFGNFQKIILLPIPSSLLPFEKPRDQAMELWDAKTRVTGVSGSLHATAIGDAVLNSYYFGAVVYGVLYPLIFFMLELAYLRGTKFRALLFSVLCVTSFYWARGAFYNGCVILIFCSLTVAIVSFIDRLKIGTR